MLNDGVVGRFVCPGVHKHALPLSFVSSGEPIDCCVDVDAPYAEKARYALSTLLVPLGLEPQWVDGAPVIYYGRDRSRAADAQLVLDCATDAAGFYADGRPCDPESVSWWERAGMRVPMPFEGRDGQPDIVASAFLWLSGWQEAYVESRDEHGRVPYAYTLAARFGNYDQPVVDAFRDLLLEQLTEAGIEAGRRKWDGRSWALCPTHDVDYVKKWRPGILYRELIEVPLLQRSRLSWKQRLKRLRDVIRQMFGGDPYRAALETMPQVVREHDGTATYFVKSGAGDPHDVPYDLGSAFLRDWLARIEELDFEVGLHPSYAAPDDVEKLTAERDRLNAAVGARVASVRQHYLRYHLPQTAVDHEEMGFRIDSTIGFAEHEGFRRGTCQPFQVFDLQNNRPTDVWEMPLTIMDSALFNRRHYDVEEAVDATLELARTVKRYGGVLVVLWHNTLGDEIDCPGWNDHFRRTLAHARDEGAHIASLQRALCGWE